MADSLRKYGDTAGGRQFLVNAAESILIVGSGAVLLTRIDGNRAQCVQQPREQRDLPQLRVTQEMDGRSIDLTDQEQAVHQRVGMIARQDDCAAVRDVLCPHNLTSMRLKKVLATRLRNRVRARRSIQKSYTRVCVLSFAARSYPPTFVFGTIPPDFAESLPVSR